MQQRGSFCLNARNLVFLPRSFAMHILETEIHKLLAVVSIGEVESGTHGADIHRLAQLALAHELQPVHSIAVGHAKHVLGHVCCLFLDVGGFIDGDGGQVFVVHVIHYR